MNVWHYAMSQLMSNIAQKIKVKTSRNSNNKKTTADWSWFIENMSWIRTCHLSTKIQLTWQTLDLLTLLYIYYACRLQLHVWDACDWWCQTTSVSNLNLIKYMYTLGCLNDPTKHLCIKTRSLNVPADTRCPSGSYVTCIHGRYC